MRIRSWVALIATVVLIAAAGGYLVITSSGASKRVSPAGGRERVAADIAKALERLPTDPGSLVAESAKALLGDDAAQGVPPGSRVNAHPASWRPDGRGGGVIRITVTTRGDQPQDYLAVMVHEVDGWKVAETYPIGVDR